MPTPSRKFLSTKLQKKFEGTLQLTRWLQREAHSDPQEWECFRQAYALRSSGSSDPPHTTQTVYTHVWGHKSCPSLHHGFHLTSQSLYWACCRVGQWYASGISPWYPPSSSVHKLYNHQWPASCVPVVCRTFWQLLCCPKRDPYPPISNPARVLPQFRSKYHALNPLPVGGAVVSRPSHWKSV